jgi:U1 small nuclear ribonucleoprotein
MCCVARCAHYPRPHTPPPTLAPSLSHTHTRGADILNLFRPNEPLPFLPLPREPAEPAPSTLCGVAPFASAFETGPAPPVEHSETPEERRAKRRADRAAKHQAQLDGLVAGWDPKRNPAATADAYKTLFVARLAYETTERKLQKEFEAFGPIVSVRLVKDQAGQSRGYAFIEYKDGEDLKRAYRRGDGLRIDGRRVLVDVERARTVRGAWGKGRRC